jgi:hypothetical protein
MDNASMRTDQSVPEIKIGPLLDKRLSTIGKEYRILDLFLDLFVFASCCSRMSPSETAARIALSAAFSG